MNADALRAWRERLAARVDVAPLRPRTPLLTADRAHTIGSLEDELGTRLAAAGLLEAGHLDAGVREAGPFAATLPAKRRGAATSAWLLPAAANADAALAEIARWMHARQLGGRWRDELLAVVDTNGAPVAEIERAAVRPLGIATHAVHLVGHRADGTVWVQQRALDKATDPGLWDTLMGGLVSARESIPTTLERETWEEAGLRLEALEALRPFGRTTVRRPVADGYMVEFIEMFEARLPEALAPQNQDGEVAQFARLAPSALRERLIAEEFTLEAAWILAHWLAPRADV